MSTDSIAQYQEAKSGLFSDWHPPSMSMVWRFFLKFHDGPASMLILQISLFILAIFLLSAHFIPKIGYISLLIPPVFSLPWIVNFSGTIWKDILLADLWFLAVAIIVWSLDKRPEARACLFVTVILLLVLGSTLRWNAIFGFPALIVTAYWMMIKIPAKLSQAILSAVLISASGLLLVGITTTAIANIWHVDRRFPAGMLIAFDLAAIAKNSDATVHPIELSSAEREKLESCYNPETAGPVLWGDCKDFGLKIIVEGQKRPISVVTGWLSNIYLNPVTYVTHRFWHTASFLRIAGYKRPYYIFHYPSQAEEAGFRQPRGVLFEYFRNYIREWKFSAMFKPITWLIVSLGLLLYAVTRHGDRNTRILVGGLAVSSGMYLMGYSIVGVAADFRYAYWSVIACTTGMVIALFAEIERALFITRGRGKTASGTMA